jgi:GNAT superfamily N-acetyltransferase
MNEVKITGYRPGAIGRITELHALYYSRHWKFGLFFEAKVAGEMGDFLRRFEEGRDGFWIAAENDRILGSIAIDGIKADSVGAHLRWFIVAPECRGLGVGNRLIKEAVDFCRRKGYRRIYLWTFQGLDPARHLYEKHGFRLAEEHGGAQWGVTVKEQRFDLIL